MALDLTKPLVLKSKQVKSFKTAPWRWWWGDGVLSVSAKAAGEWSKQSKVKGLWGMTHQFSSSVCSTSAPLKAPVTTGILQQLPPRPHTVSHMGCNSRLWHRPAPNPVCEHRSRSQKLHSLFFLCFAEKCHHWTFRNCWYGTVVMQSAETLKCTALTQIIFRDMNVTFPAFISFLFQFWVVSNEHDGVFLYLFLSQCLHFAAAAPNVTRRTGADSQHLNLWKCRTTSKLATCSLRQKGSKHKCTTSILSLLKVRQFT